MLMLVEKDLGPIKQELMDTYQMDEEDIFTPFAERA